MMAITSLSPAQSLAPSRINNIVLVHGAFNDGSSWAEVIGRLQNKGYRVSAVQNPLTSLADDVAATRRVVERQDGDVLLVGHSWAGVVVTEAGNAPKVKALAYLSAIVPDSGESAADFLTRRNAPMDGLRPDANGLLWLDGPEQYRAVMAHDVPLEKVRILAATQQPIAASAFAQKVGTAAWRTRPSWYLMTEDDHALPPAVQRWTIKHIGANSISLRSSHMSIISSPQEVADFIDRAARGSAVQ
ncbi:MAG: alpha/beta hydrolase [Duganella sp.]